MLIINIMQDRLCNVSIKYGIEFYLKKVILSKEQRFDSSSLSSDLCISLGLTLSWYHIPGEECKSYPSNPNPVTTKLVVLTTPTPLQGHMIFSMYQT